MKRAIGSDLNLDGWTVSGAQPGAAPYGPAEIPSTAAKQLQRRTAWLSFMSAACTLLVVAILLYMALQA